MNKETATMTDLATLRANLEIALNHLRAKKKGAAAEMNAAQLALYAAQFGGR
jgi:hypothetical protein